MQKCHSNVKADLHGRSCPETSGNQGRFQNNAASSGGLIEIWTTRMNSLDVLIIHTRFEEGVRWVKQWRNWKMGQSQVCRIAFKGGFPERLTSDKKKRRGGDVFLSSKVGLGHKAIQQMFQSFHGGDGSSTGHNTSSSSEQFVNSHYKHLGLVLWLAVTSFDWKMQER